MTTTAKVDNRLRVRIPDAKPGQVVTVQSSGEGWTLSLVKEPQPNPAKKWTKAEVLEAMDKSPIRFTKSWEDLKKETR
jgi:hypothetical protein